MIGHDIGDGYIGSPISAQTQCAQDVRCEGFVCLNQGESECYLKDSSSPRKKMSDAVLYTRRIPKAKIEGEFTLLKEVWVTSSVLSSLQKSTAVKDLTELCEKDFECNGFVYDEKTNYGQIITRYLDQNMLIRGTKSQNVYVFSGQRTRVDEERFQIERDSLLKASSSNCHKTKKETNRVLLTLTAGVKHHSNVVSVIRKFREESTSKQFDFVIFHWDDSDETKDWSDNDVFRDVKHVWSKGEVKLGFARTFLTPEFVCSYDYVFLWDGDVVLPSNFDASRMMQILRSNDIDIAQPALGEDSQVSYHHTKPIKGSVFHEAWFAEIGFLMYRTETWLRVWGMLQEYPFRLWWFDVIPYTCVASARKIAVIDEQYVIHKQRGKTLHIDFKQTLKEKEMRNQIVRRFGCCSTLKSLPKGSPRPSLQKCQCTADGMYC